MSASMTQKNNGKKYYGRSLCKDTIRCNNNNNNINCIVTHDFHAIHYVSRLTFHLFIPYTFLSNILVFLEMFKIFKCNGEPKCLCCSRLTYDQKNSDILDISSLQTCFHKHFSKMNIFLREDAHKENV